MEIDSRKPEADLKFAILLLIFGSQNNHM